jgi:hypothetical protein
MRKILSAALTGLVLLLSTPAFAAEPSTDDRAVARSLFEQGRTMMKESNFAEACPKLEESQRLDPGVGTLFNLADCYEHLNRIASAWAAFAEAADLAKRAGHEDREMVARERQSLLVPKLSKMRVHVATPLPPGLELRLDNKPLSTAILDNDLPVDAGDHRIHVSAPGKVAAETAVKIEADVAITNVEIPMLADVPPPEVVPVVGPVRPEEPPPQRGSSWQKPAAIAAGAGAIVGLGLGTIFGLKASSEWSDAQAMGCDKACSPTGYDKWDDSRSSATIGTVGFVAGGLLAAAAVILFVTAPGEASPPPAVVQPVGVREWLRPTGSRASSSLWRMP